jgi:hypothetical protein
MDFIPLKKYEVVRKCHSGGSLHKMKDDEKSQRGAVKFPPTLRCFASLQLDTSQFSDSLGIKGIGKKI